METFSALLDISEGNSPVPLNSPHKGQWRGALMFSLICVWINGWVNNGEAGDLRSYHAHYDATVMHRFGDIKMIHRLPDSPEDKCSPECFMYEAQWNMSVNKSRLNTLRLKQNSHYLSDDIFKCIFLNENFQFWINFHWKVFLGV